MPFAGQLFTPDYPYQPRYPWGSPGDIKLVSLVAEEDIRPGCLVGVNPSTNLLRNARPGDKLAGVSVYDPAHNSSSVVYNRYDVVPVLRRGSVYVAFVAAQPPFRAPWAMEVALAYLDGTGRFTTDGAGVLVPRTVFSLASKDYYPNSDGSAAADYPYPVPPIPMGVTNTTFGDGVALVDINLP